MLILGVAAGLAVTRAGAATARSVSLDDVSAWLLSRGAGEAELVDGNTGQVITRVALGGASLSGTQSGPDELVADSAAGTVRRIDGSTYRLSPPVRFARPADPLAVYAGTGRAFLVDRTSGLVRVADPRSLAVRATYSLAANVPAGGIVTDAADGLWAVDSGNGDLVRVTPDGTTTQPHAVDAARTHLVTADGRPVAVDLSARRAWRLGRRGLTGTGACVGTTTGDDTVAVVGSASAARVYLTSGSRGTLMITDLTTGRCGTAVDLGTAGDVLGQPREAAGRVFIPDVTAGEVLVVDVAAQRVIAHPSVLPPGTSFELVGQNGAVFFNDPASARAGVIGLDGSVRPVQKYDPTPTGGTPGGQTAPPGTRPSQPPVQPTSQPTGPASAPGTRPRSTPAAPDPTNQPADPAAPPTGTPSAGQGPATGPSAAGARIEVSAAQAKVGDSLTLRAVVVDANGQPTTARLTDVAWTFGDGATGAGERVDHAWSAAGTYRVAATVQVAGGAALTAATAITVVPAAAPTPPTAALAVSPATGDAPLTVTADASASRAGAAPIASYRVDFGDGSTASSQTASHTYAQPGSYTVTLTVTDTAGLTATATRGVTAGSALTARLGVSPSSGQAPLQVTADASGSSGSGALRYQFDFGDGSAAVGPQSSASAGHTYAAAGTYPVRVTVTGPAGTATAQQTVTVTDEKPHFSVTPTSGAAPLTITLHVTGPDGTYYHFDFGDPAEPNSGFFQRGTVDGHQYTYANPGTYTIRMDVELPDGQPVDDYQEATVTVSGTTQTTSPGIAASYTYLDAGICSEQYNLGNHCVDITLKSTGTAPLHITSITSNGDADSNAASCVTTLAVGASCTWHDVVGIPSPNQIRIDSDAPDSPTNLSISP
ncbi:PKD domain-containing protein [Pseudofrankia inefficax]|uniref:PKD domain-containing protein n=1 Tax=Pseudofrankia inefficax (strain DSM 45817 / CECT 9037 / DDB 130130 / EuI1c) TaxID=298654 RepID=UPI0001BFB39D|nr:PKD domain-containing protein [Pseudofrankia inefficax]